MVIKIPGLDQICQAGGLNPEKVSASYMVTSTEQIWLLKQKVSLLLCVSPEPFLPVK